MALKQKTTSTGKKRTDWQAYYPSRVLGQSATVVTRSPKPIIVLPKRKSVTAKKKK